MTFHSDSSVPQGDENLEVMRSAPRYTTHIGHLVHQFLPENGKLLELGSGDGLQTSRVMGPSDKLTCIETSPSRQATLRGKGYKVVESLDAIDTESHDALFSFNCLEHIDDDLGVMKEVNRSLRRGGRVILYVPAMPVLYSSMDKHVGHYRRYTKRTLTQLLDNSGFDVSHIRFVDSFGVIPSLIYRVLPSANGEPSEKSIALYDRYFFPLSRLVDKLLGGLLGKNLLVVGEKS